MPNTIASLSIKPLHPHIGALVNGVDLTQQLSEVVFAQIRAAFNQFSVLVFRNQAINDEQQVGFSRRFNALEEVSFSIAAQNPYVYHLSNVDDRGHLLGPNEKKRVFLKVNSRWHTDSSFKPIPAMASILSGRKIPSHEPANTEFASMRVGYASLPPERRNMLRGLAAIHHYGYSLGLFGDGGVPLAEIDSLPPSQHPLLRVHPETGETSLFVSGHIESIVGMPVKEGRELVNELIAWCTRQEYVYSHSWEQDDLVMWDNRCTLHRAAVIPEREIRRVHRTTVMGEGSIEEPSSETTL